MNEKLRNIGHQINEAVNKIAAKVLDMPVSYDEAVSTFVHKKDCSQSSSLIKTERENLVNLRDGGGWGINPVGMAIKQRYVECGECHESKRYSD